jgi:hypothetical protein
MSGEPESGNHDSRPMTVTAKIAFFSNPPYLFA